MRPDSKTSREAFDWLCILLLATSPFVYHSACASSFKTNAPAIWVKVSSAGEDREIYVNSRSSANETVVLYSSPISEHETRSQELLATNIKAFSKARAALFSLFAIHSYAVLSIEVQKEKFAAKKSVTLIQSIFQDLKNRDVQMLERQYLRGLKMFSVTYLIDSPALNDRARAERSLDYFRPIIQRGRMPASSPEVVAAQENETADVPPASALPPIVRDIDMKDPENAKQCEAFCGTDKSKCRQLGDAPFSSKLGTEFAEGWGCLHGLKDGIWGLIKSIWDLGWGSVKFVWNYKLSLEYRTQINSAVGVVVAEVYKDPSSIAERLGAVVWNEAKNTLGNFFSCASNQEQMRQVCSLATNFIPAGLLWKMVTEVPKTAAESLHISEAIRRGVGGEAALVKDKFKSSSSIPAERSSFAKIKAPAIEVHREWSLALRDPRVERARALGLADDFKELADLVARPLTPTQVRGIEMKAEAIHTTDGEAAEVKYWISARYENRNELIADLSSDIRPHWTVASPQHRATFEHVESMWSKLVKRTPAHTDSSLIPLPNRTLIPGARFQEGYYWDSYFAFPTLLRTGRVDLVRGQIDNFLFQLKHYGVIPNGGRDYYLTRSQPPLISQMVRLLVEHEETLGPLSAETKKWLITEAYPLIARDYKDFWMNPKTRFDKNSGLNHHFDSLDSPRPERHSSDRDDLLGKSYRHVRAEAESGKDFTDAFDGEAGNYAGVMLNSILFQSERDLAWMARIAGDSAEAGHFESAALARKSAMNRTMWDQTSGAFRDFNLRTQAQSPMITADTFVPLHFSIASEEQAKTVAVKSLPLLEGKGGVVSSDKTSGKQWDAPFGWAPQQYFAISGLERTNHPEEAKRIASKFVGTVEKIYEKTGKIIEKIDAVKGDIPVEAGDKYPTQDGFLWTNGVYAWALSDILGVKLVPTR